MFKGLKCELFGRMLQVPAMEIFNSISRRMMAQMTAQKHLGPQWHSRISAEAFGQISCILAGSWCTVRLYARRSCQVYILRYNNRCNYDIYWLCIYIAITSFGSTWCRVLCCLLIRFMFPPALLPKCFCSHYQEQALQAVEFCAIDWLWFIQWESMVYWDFNACLLV